MRQPAVNITIPVFNRFVLTQKTLLALHKSRGGVPFSITVVDNGSDPPLVSRLRELHQAGIIDKLFLLPENMGISCACNIGWAMTDAPLYMKLDNDCLIQDPGWLEKLFRLWRHGAPLSTLGPAWTEEQLLANEGALHTPDGILGICRTNLQGSALFIPKAVSDILGFWSEDYGLYGAEDGDYGLRMTCADFPQYYYLASGLIQNMGWDEKPDDIDYVLDRQGEHRALFLDNKGGTGLFRLNSYLYHHCIRNWKVPLKYEVDDVDDNCKVRLKERKDYIPVQQALAHCKRLVDKANASDDPDALYREEFIEGLKDIMRECGQACS